MTINKGNVNHTFFPHIDRGNINRMFFPMRTKKYKSYTLYKNKACQIVVKLKVQGFSL